MDAINWQTIFFFLFAIMAVGSAFYAVVITENVVRAAFALMATFGGMAGLFGVLGADFLVAVQLIVYVGGILVLILFGVMMSRRATVAELPGSRPTPLAWAGIAGLAAALLFVGYQVFAKTQWNVRELPPAEPLAPKLGELFLGQYLLPFEFISLLLLGALIGAVILARKEVR